MKINFLQFVLAALLFLLISIQCVFQPSGKKNDPDPATERNTESGKVIGYVEENGTHAWLGIPYAGAPKGERRWKAPRPADKWKDTLEAVEFGQICPQYGGIMANVPVIDYNDPVGNEDCLFLNIWGPKFTPESIPSGNSRIPVMVWIHGGGNSVGEGGTFNGRVLAGRYNVIVITLNYRLGPLGWFSHPALRESGGTPADASGNYGTLDIIRALEWIKNNISSFGGDPENVTIFGESAGAKDVISLMLSPFAKGLFHKAISESGAPFTAEMSKAENYSDAEQKGHNNSSREIVNRLLLRDGIAANREQAVKYQDKMSGKQLAGYLRSKTSEELISMYEPGAAGMISFPNVIRDGTVIPAGDPFDIITKKAAYNPVPVILGTNRDEYKTFMAIDPEFINLFGIKDQKYYDLVASYLSDEWKATGADEIAVILRETQGPTVYVYRFDWDEEPSLLGSELSSRVGAGHAVEIPFVFNNFDVVFPGFSLLYSKSNLTGRMALSDSMSSYWAEFAHSGAPGKGISGKEIEWKAWNNSPGSDKFITFDTPQDHGITMSPNAVMLADIKKRLVSENGIKNQEKLCRIYVRIFGKVKEWNDDEYEKLGEQGCADYPRERFE
ncbi:MAG: carboxylesterase family protein [Spirochaetes bacterium]|nr:carboxylesterase family protein [Spirochaetota bacterium]